MIRIFLGNVGSGKSISCIKEILENQDEIYFSNIITKSKGKFKTPNNFVINRDNLIKKEVVEVKKNGSKVYKIKFNKEQWEEYRRKYGSYNIVLDEFHTLMGARNFNSRQNKVLSDFLALIRKLCSNSNGNSTLTLISQLDNKIDINARDMATEVRYHICIYTKICSNCGAYWNEHSELSPFMKHKFCPNCNSKKLKLNNHKLMVHYFDSMNSYQEWKYSGINTKIQTTLVSNVSQYFGYYDTDQLDDLISEE